MAEKRDYTTVEHKKPYRYEEDGLHVTRGCGWSAPGCHLGCGVLLYTDDDGRLVKVEGDPENPFNQGRIDDVDLGLKRFIIQHFDGGFTADHR